MNIKPIGVIRTPFTSSEGITIQAHMSDELGEVVLHSEYASGLHSLNQFSHIILLYWFHQSKDPQMLVRPYLGNEVRGLFSTRAPARPNPIGISVVEVVKMENNRIVFRGADMLDNTPLLDIKPFVPEFDHRPHATSGWLSQFLDDENTVKTADNRFEH